MEQVTPISPNFARHGHGPGGCCCCYSHGLRRNKQEHSQPLPPPLTMKLCLNFLVFVPLNTGCGECAAAIIEKKQSSAEPITKRAVEDEPGKVSFHVKS